jgi:hypothetical protein
MSLKKFKFKFPRVEAETMIVEAEDIITAAGIAKKAREDHAKILRIDGEEVIPEPSLTSPGPSKSTLFGGGTS